MQLLPDLFLAIFKNHIVLTKVKMIFNFSKSTMIQDSVYFISDAHFGIGIDRSHEREDFFFKFLEHISSSLSTLYILGDFFNFWIEYRYAIRSDYFNILHKLKTLVDNGVKIHYLAGNHDFALGTFLHNYLNITIHHGALDTLIQGKKVHLFHGDGIRKKDLAHRYLHKILRNGYCQKVYRLLHPGVGINIGSYFSRSENKHIRKKNIPEFVLNEYREIAQKYISAGSDIVIFAHTHVPELYIYKNGIYCNTGSWLVQNNFASMQNGQIKNWRFLPDFAFQEILPIIYK